MTCQHDLRSRVECIDRLYGPKFGNCSPESIRRLIREIDVLMPGIRLERNLEVQTVTSGVPLTYQMVLNYLTAHGFLSPASLDLFRSLDGIESLDLRETLKSCSLLLPTDFRVELLQGISLNISINPGLTNYHSASSSKQFLLPHATQP